MKFVRFAFLFLPLALTVGCSGSSTTPTTSDVDASGQPVSSVPWNKPESWETQGQLGGMQQ